MKTFCIVKQDGSYDIIRGVWSFEVDELSNSMHEAALRFCLSQKRPMSIMSKTVFSGGGSFKAFRQTRFENQLPVEIGGMKFKPVVAREV